MASRMKEDEKNEKIIRGLLKLPANRRCINCNSLGPQYVCTNFATFICTNCSGIHREFTHRVKSISMAKFTSQEVSALQEGGNKCAKEIYFKEWDQQRHSFPDSSNIDRLREFIRHVYVDRRFSGERNYDRPARAKGDTEDLYDKRKIDSYRGSKSSSFDDADGRKYGERPGSASPTYDNRTSPGRFDRDDKSGHRSLDRITPAQQPDIPRLEERSSSEQKDVDTSKSFLPQPVRAVSIAPPAPVGDPAKPSGLQLLQNSAPIQNTASPSSRGSSIGNSVEMKAVTSRSLIDFDADPVLPAAGSLDKSGDQQNTSLTAESGGWASFDDSSSIKKAQAASAISTLDSVLSQLSVPQNASAANTPSISAAGFGPFPNQNNTMHWPNIPQHQPSLFQAPNVQPGNLPFSTAIAGTPDYQIPPQASTSVYGPATLPSGQTSQGITKPLHEANVEVSLQHTADAKPSGRTELPADLFTMTYAPMLAPFPYYNTSQHPMGFGMQYPSAVAMPTYSRPPASINPFALSDERKLVHSSTFPNLSPLQGVLPNVDNHPSILRATSLPTQQWFPHQQFPVSVVPQMQSSGLYVVQQGASPMPQPSPNPMYPGTHQMPQITGVAHNFSGNEHLDSRNYRPHTPNSFAPGGNPFG